MTSEYITGPISKVVQWVKRHWLLTLAIFVLLFVIPPFFAVVAMTLGQLLAIIAGILKAIKLPIDTVDRVMNSISEYVNRFLDWLGKDTKRNYWLAIFVGVFFPIVGFFIAAWSFLDTFKDSNIKLEAEPGGIGPTTPPPITIPDPSKNDGIQLPSIFNGDIGDDDGDISGQA